MLWSPDDVIATTQHRVQMVPLVPLVVALKQVYTTRHRAYTTYMYATRCSANKTLQNRPLLTQFSTVRRGSK